MGADVFSAFPRTGSRLSVLRDDEFIPALFRAPGVVTADDLRDAAASANVAVFESYQRRHAAVASSPRRRLFRILHPPPRSAIKQINETPAQGSSLLLELSEMLPPPPIQRRVCIQIDEAPAKGLRPDCPYAYSWCC